MPQVPHGDFHLARAPFATHTLSPSEFGQLLLQPRLRFPITTDGSNPRKTALAGRIRYRGLPVAVREGRHAHIVVATALTANSPRIKKPPQKISVAAFPWK